MKTFYTSFLILLIINISVAQTFETPFSQKKMRKDLAIFKNIRFEANSGLYKYRTKQQIDSIYSWADRQIEISSSYGDFYNIICALTDFEGSLHNDNYLPKKINQSLRLEEESYFPYPIKWIDGKWIINYDKGEIPLGSEIITINNEKIEDIVKNLYKYYSTDGFNTSGKKIGIRTDFAKLYRLHYGISDSFKIEYLQNKNTILEKTTIKSVTISKYYEHFRNRYSKPYDNNYYATLVDSLKYNLKNVNMNTSILTINTFDLGDENSIEHKKYASFLDSIFKQIKINKIQNLVVDVRLNGGGTDPNDLVTYSYLTNRNFSENKQAWISFKKIPYLKYIDSKIPVFVRFIGVGKYNKILQKEFYLEKENGNYQGPLSDDQMIREPNKNAFNGQIYLMISPAVASAGSLFAAMVAGNDNTIVVGEETMGGYYGHNGHTPLEYILPNSKITTSFSIVNLEQDVPKKENQIYNRGIIPDYNITQSYDDYLNQNDNQMEFVLELIKKNTINK